jgi:PadR family transcriptional regulator AphA
LYEDEGDHRVSPMTRQPLGTELALLGFLRQRPMHGYEIYQQLADPAGLWAIWRMKQSQLYALLDRLEEEGYVTATLKPQQSRPARRVFRLNKAGRDIFLKWVQLPVKHGREIRLDFLAKFYFARREGAKTATTLISNQREACQDWLAEQRLIAKAQAAASDEWLISQFRIGQIKATLGWLDQCESLVRAGPAAE